MSPNAGNLVTHSPIFSQNLIIMGIESSARAGAAESILSHPSHLRLRHTLDLHHNNYLQLQHSMNLRPLITLRPPLYPYFLLQTNQTITLHNAKNSFIYSLAPNFNCSWYLYVSFLWLPLILRSWPVPILF